MVQADSAWGENMPAGTSRSFALGLVLAALLVLVGSRTSFEASSTTFNPSFSVTLSKYGSQEPADITYALKLEKPDAMPAEMISFTPGTWTIAGDADVPEGAVVGVLERKSRWAWWAPRAIANWVGSI
jgi:hypothetical protein